jgi:hypothetical protein
MSPTLEPGLFALVNEADHHRAVIFNAEPF